MSRSVIARHSRPLGPGSVATLCAVTGAISVTSFWGRGAGLSARELAASPAAVADGRVWLLVTSGLVADRPAAAAVAGFLLVGLATVALCGPRMLWLAAAAGHVVSALAVYLAIGFVRLFAPTALGGVLTLSDFGTSAVIAAWIGVLAYRWWRARASLVSRAGAVSFVLLSGLIGWLLRPDLTLLDAEHAVAFCIGVGVARHAVRAPETARRLGLWARPPRYGGLRSWTSSSSTAVSVGPHTRATGGTPAGASPPFSAPARSR